MAKLDLLRKLIREEVRGVFQEELATILKEAIVANKSTNPIVESTRPRPVPPSTLNRHVPRPVAPVLNAGNPLNSLLAETARAMSVEEFGDLNGDPIEKEVPIVESVGDMFASARGSSSIEAVQINAVPDFTAIMNRMKANN